MFLLFRFLEIDTDRYTYFSSPVSLRLIRSFLGIMSLLLLCVTSHALAADVTLSWNDPNNNQSEVGGYNLYYWQTGTIPIVVNAGKTKIYTLTGLEAGKTYHFATTAHDGSGGRESAFSDEVTFTVPAAPSPSSPLAATGHTGGTGTTGNTGGSGTASHTDSDHDGFADSLELYYGADPSDPSSMPSLTDLVVRGETSITHNWKRVALNPPLLDPVVIAKPLSINEGDPAVVRIRNVASTGFDIRVQEWDYLDGPHITEAVAYLVMERGTFVFENATGKFIMVEAGTFTTNQTTFRTVPFSQSFNTTPVVLTTVNTVNEADAVTGRLRNISRTGFQFRLQEQENNANSHATETIAYMAWEPVTGTIDGVSVDVDSTGKVVTHAFYALGFNLTFNTAPVFLADMQTAHGGDAANLRWKNKGRFGVQVQVDEEQSRDSETSHIAEIVGYITMR